jgi:hypothetical protein
MGHYCGASNRTVGGSCGRWLVNYDHCADHRRAVPPSGDYQVGGYVVNRGSFDRAEVLSNVLTDGLDAALGDLVVDYVGAGATRRLRHRRRRARDCQEIADAATAVVGLKDKAHDFAGKSVAGLLPAGTPRFTRELTAKIAEKLPLPWDAKLEAIARGLQALGIFLCMVQLLPPTACPCLGMVVDEMPDEAIKTSVTELISDARMDLSQTASARGSGAA